jgi:hypothetical protein
MNAFVASTEIRSRSSRKPDAPVGWGAAIIDEKGNEVPITESMVSRACEELAGCWVFPVRDRRQAC